MYYKGSYLLWSHIVFSALAGRSTAACTACILAICTVCTLRALSWVLQCGHSEVANNNSAVFAKEDIFRLKDSVNF